MKQEFKSERGKMHADPRLVGHTFNFPFWRDENILWKTDVPVEKMKVDELSWIFDLPFWENDEGVMCITPKEVMQNPNVYPKHRDRMNDCDVSYPIDLAKNPQGKWLTLDGLHRLVKLVTAGETIVNVRKFSPEQVELTAIKNKKTT